jgi:hypothetical protein
LVDIVGSRYGNLPLHATLTIAAGADYPVVADFPENTLIKDLAAAYNAILNSGWRLSDSDRDHRRTDELANKSKKAELFDLIIEQRRNERNCLLSCYHLLEGYMNALAFDRVNDADKPALSPKNRLYLQEQKQTKKGIRSSFISLKDKILNFPVVITGKEGLPLQEDNKPLSTIVETVKVFRDSIVHPSPFSAPSHFGGYDKLEHIRNLNFEIVDQAVDATFEVIEIIHRFMGYPGDKPEWLPPKLPNGRFLLTHLPRSKL